ncbi:MAG: hypothetical protein MHMPM18_000374, partial [Marteilia pararefringens]
SSYKSPLMLPKSIFGKKSSSPPPSPHQMFLTILAVSIVSQIVAEEIGDPESKQMRITSVLKTKNHSGSSVSFSQQVIFDAPTPIMDLICDSLIIECKALDVSKFPKGLSAYQKLVTDNELDFVQRYDCEDTAEKFSKTQSDAGNMKCERIIQKTS